MFFTLSDISGYKVQSNYGAIVCHGSCNDNKLEQVINEAKEKMLTETKNRKGNAIINYKVSVKVVKRSVNNILFTLSGDAVFLQEIWGTIKN